MAIETLDDILTEIADRIGIYGAHGDDMGGEGYDAVTCTERKPCRPCFESNMRDRILAAVEVERKLGAAHR